MTDTPAPQSSLRSDNAADEAQPIADAKERVEKAKALRGKYADLNLATQRAAEDEAKPWATDYCAECGQSPDAAIHYPGSGTGAHQWRPDAAFIRRGGYGRRLF